MTDLYKKTLYLKDIDFLINTTIYEYDLSKANISILRQANLITDDLYNILYNADRMDRQVFIGKLQKKDPNIAKALEVGFIEARRLFFEANGLEERDVLSIKKDAIFTFKRCLNLQVAEWLIFKEKNLYTSYYHIPSQKKELYYLKHPFTGAEVLDIKGMNDESFHYHTHYMIEFLLVLFETAQTDIVEALDMISRFVSLYRSRRLEVGFYRNLNSESKFYYISNPNAFSSFSAEYLLDNQVGYLDISYNDLLLRDLYKCISKQYFLTHKKPRC